jgi:hypothetical protein
LPKYPLIPHIFVFSGVAPAQILIAPAGDLQVDQIFSPGAAAGGDPDVLATQTIKGETNRTGRTLSKAVSNAQIAPER